jgi:transcription antitermination protein NusB
VRARRRRARDVAFQVLFQHDVGHAPINEALAALPRDDHRIDWALVDELCRGAAGRQQDLDALIARHLSGWTLERLASSDRVVLRMALYELIHTSTPAAVVINEAVDLAKRYGTDESGAFVNGVLRVIQRERSDAIGSRSSPP